MTRFLLAAVAAFMLALPATAGAASWDATGLDLSPAYTGSVNAVAVAPADDGAIWAAWAVDPDGAGGAVDVYARRVNADGVRGAIRTLQEDGAPTSFASVSLAALAGGKVRVSYVGAAGRVVAVRRLTPTQTGAQSLVYDEDGDGAANDEKVTGQRLLAAPGGATWALIQRNNGIFGTSPVVEARRIAADDTPGPLTRVSGLSHVSEAAGVVDAGGRLIVAMPAGGPGRIAAVAVDAGGTAGPEAEVRPSSGPSVSAVTPAIGIDAAGIATIGWDLNASPARAEVQRLDTTTTPMTTGGAPVTPLNAGIPADYSQYGPLLAVDAGGSAIAGWSETDSFQDNNDAFISALAAGDLSTPGAVGPRVQLDGPAPQAGYPTAALAGPGGVASVYFTTAAGNAVSCQVARVTTSGGLAGSDPLPPTCRSATAPAEAGAGLAAAWVTNSPYTVQIARPVDAAPSCTDGAPVTVTAGLTTTLPLTCTGWRPAREVVGSAALGTLGAVDEAAGTVTYTAGGTPGADTVTFRARNAAGVSVTRSLPVTVAAAQAPTPPAPTPGAGPDPGPGKVTVAADGASPVVTRLKVKPSQLKLTKLRAPIATFSLSEAATVTVRVERLQRGRRVRGQCLPAKKKPSARAACTKATRMSQLTRAAPAGAAKVTIAVRGGKRTLPAGSYRVTVRAVDAAGNRSTPATARFTIAF